jgi:hypothetical protein
MIETVLEKTTRLAGNHHAKQAQAKQVDPEKTCQHDRKALQCAKFSRRVKRPLPEGIPPHHSVKGMKSDKRTPCIAGMKAQHNEHASLRREQEAQHCEQEAQHREPVALHIRHEE